MTGMTNDAQAFEQAKATRRPFLSAPIPYPLPHVQYDTWSELADALSAAASVMPAIIDVDGKSWTLEVDWMGFFIWTYGEDLTLYATPGWEGMAVPIDATYWPMNEQWHLEIAPPVITIESYLGAVAAAIAVVKRDLKNPNFEEEDDE